MVNEQGGVNGLPVRLVLRDDGYYPKRTSSETRSLVEGQGVDLFAGSMGTPTQAAVQNYLNDAGIPQILVVSGHPGFNQPNRFPWSMGWHPSYEVEGMVFGRWIRLNHPEKKIAVLYQDDSFGGAYVRGLRNGLGDSAVNLVARESYLPSDSTMDDKVRRLAQSGASIFVNIAIPKYAAQAIRAKAELGWPAIHLLASVSASVKSTLRAAGLQNAEGILSSGYLKDPGDPTWANDSDIRDYRGFMKAHAPAEDADNAFNAFAFALGHVLIDILQRSGPDYAPDRIMEAALSIQEFDPPMLLPGITVNTAPGDHVPISAMWMTQFDGQRFSPLEGPIRVNCCRSYDGQHF